MKRDMELIRKLVLGMEDCPEGFGSVANLDGYTDEQIGYHAYLMIQAGLAEGNETTHSDSTGPGAYLRNLTWQGHEFADAARDDSRWLEAMRVVKEKAGSVTMGVLTQLLTSLAKTALGIP
jgi:hypothetical protein